MVNFTSLTSINPSIEGENRMNVLTNSLEENGNSDVVAKPTNIVSEDKGMGTLRVIRNQSSSTTENAS